MVETSILGSSPRTVRSGSSPEISASHTLISTPRTARSGSLRMSKSFFNNPYASLYDMLITVTVPDSRINALDFIGIWAETYPEVTCVYPPESTSAILKSIAKFVFPKQLDIVTLDAVHAAYRYYSFKGEFFTFTVHKQSLDTVCFCYVFRSIRLVAMDNGRRTAIVPIAFIVISERPSVDLYYSVLAEWNASRTTAPDLLIHKMAKQFQCTRSATEYMDAWFSVPVVHILSDNPLILFQTIMALLREEKVMVTSHSVSLRSMAVLGLYSILQSTRLPWPHPCLACPPEDISYELPNAPTPVLAAVKESNGLTRTAVWLNIDACTLIPNEAVGLELSDSLVPVVSDSLVEWTHSQSIMTVPGITKEQVRDHLNTIEGIRSKINQVVGEIDITIGSCTKSYQSELSMIESKFSFTSIQSIVFRSQAFHIQR